MVNIVTYPSEYNGIGVYVYYKNDDIEKLKEIVYNKYCNDPHVESEDDITIILIPKNKLSEFLKNEKYGYYRYDGEDVYYVPHPDDIKLAKKLVEMGLIKLIVHHDEYDYPMCCNLEFNNGVRLKNVYAKDVPIEAIRQFYDDKVEVKDIRNVYDY